MSISIWDIAEKFQAAATINVLECTAIRNASLINENQISFEKDTIYIGNIDAICGLVNQADFVNLICVIKNKQTLDCLSGHLFNLIMIEDQLDFAAILEKVKCMINDDNFMINSSLQLYDALSSNKGLQHIIEVAFKLFSKLFLCCLFNRREEI